MKPKILVVDDEVSILESLRGILQDEGYLVSSPASGEQALEEIFKDPPDLVLLDIWLPGMDGLAVLGEMKKALFPVFRSLSFPAMEHRNCRQSHQDGRL